MRFLDRPLSLYEGHPADDLDGLLRTFFRAEMPYPWPSWKQPSAAVTQPIRPASSRWSHLRSRLALAASVGLIGLGLWLLGGKLQTAGVAKLNGSNNGSASPRRLLDTIDPKKKTETTDPVLILKGKEAFINVQANDGPSNK